MRSVRCCVILITLFAMATCAYTPKEIVTIAGSNVGVLHKVSMSRQRHITVPVSSHLGLVVSTSTSERQALVQQGKQVFEQVFSKISVLDDDGFVSTDVDFVVRANLLYVDSPMNTEERLSMDGTSKSHMSQVDGLGNKRKIGLLKPYRRTVLKLNLTDARTREILDVAVVSGRSSMTAYRNYQPILKQSLQVYSQSITATKK